MRTFSHKLNVPEAVAVCCFVIVLLTGGVQSDLLAQGLGEKQRSAAQIRESEQAKERLKQAVEHRSNNETTKFLRELQSVREEFGHFLVSVDEVEGLYRGVQARTTELLQSLNENERSTYRELFEEKASNALKTARSRGNREELNTLAEQYPLTPSGQQALKELFRSYFKEGRFHQALKPLRSRFQFLDDPSSRAETAQKMVLCLSLTGRIRELTSFSQPISDELANQNIRWSDESIKLKSFIDRRIEASKKLSGTDTPHSKSAQTWSADRETGIPDVPLYKLFPGKLQPRVLFTPSPGASRQFRHTRLSRTRQGLDHVEGIYPSTFRNHIVLNNGISAWGWHIDPRNDEQKTGPSWTLSTENIEGSDVMRDVRQLYIGDTSPDGHYFCSLVTDVGATSIPTMNLRVRYPIPWRSLFSIDVSTGEVNWKHGGRSDAGFYKNASFPSGAVYRDGVLYAPVVKFQTSNQTPSIYAAAIDAASGELLWKTFITKNMLGTNLFENPTREVIPAAPIVDQETLYITTNTGMTAAFDLENGNPEWLYRYVRWGSVRTRGIYPRRQSTFWQNNLPTIVDNTLLITPTDSLRLLALDPKTGRIEWKQEQFELSDTLQEFAEWVVPVDDNRYLISSQKSLAIFSATNGQQQSGVYNCPVPIEGRPVVTKTHIGLPTTKGIYLIRYRSKNDPNNLKLVEERRFQPGTRFQPGNLFLTEKFLMVAGNETFMAYGLPEVKTE